MDRKRLSTAGPTGTLARDPRPLLLVGPPRSGSTWVEQVLGCTANAHAIHEPDNEATDPFAFRAKTVLGRYPVLTEDDPAPSEYAELWEHAFAGQIHGPDPRWLAARVLLKHGRTNVKASYRDHRPLTAGLRVMKALAAPPSHRRGVHQVIVKSVHAPLSIEWIARRFAPEIVIIRRNPFNIVASYAQLGWLDSRLDAHPGLRDGVAGFSWVPSLDPAASPLSRVTWQVGLFTSALELAARRHPGWHVVSHEALCRDPEGGFRTLCDEVGLGWTPEATAFLSASNRPGEGLVTNRVAAEQPDRWRRRLTPEQADEVADVLSRFPVASDPDQPTA